MKNYSSNVSEVILQKAKQIKMAIFDVDGVLTDGRLILGDQGEEYKIFNVKDGQGLVMLQSCGIELAIITGRSSNVVKERMTALGIKHIYQGRSDKLPVYEELLEKTGLSAKQTAYMGDDLPDLPIIRRAGLGVTVTDAYPLLKDHAHWITESQGGRGAARELCDLILYAQGKLESQIDHYTR